MKGLCVLGKGLWLVRVEILAEAGQTFAQVEVSSSWFRGCAWTNPIITWIISSNRASFCGSL